MQQRISVAVDPPANAMQLLSFTRKGFDLAYAPDKLSLRMALSSPSSFWRAEGGPHIAGIGAQRKQHQRDRRHAEQGKLPVHLKEHGHHTEEGEHVDDNIGMAWAISSSNLSESLTTRDISWPVCLSS